MFCEPDTIYRNTLNYFLKRFQVAVGVFDQDTLFSNSKSYYSDLLQYLFCH